MLLVSCCSSAPALAIPNDSVFRLVPDYTNQGTALGKLIQHEGIEVLVPVWRGDTWGDGLSEAATSSFRDRGGQTDEGIRYNPESPEFSASTSLLAEKVRGYVDEYGADKVAVLFLGFAEILQFTQSASEHGILDDVRWFGPGANTKERKLIEDPIGLDFSTSVQFTTVQFAASKNPIYDRVQAYLTETLGTEPNTFVHSSYDAVWIIGLAMLETQSTDNGGALWSPQDSGTTLGLDGVSAVDATTAWAVGGTGGVIGLILKGVDQAPVGSISIPIDTTSLLLADTLSFSWMIPVVLSVIGIGLFAISRKSE